jgi:hypothetical protein
MVSAPSDAPLSPSEARRLAVERGYSTEAARRAAALAASSPPPEAWTRLLTLAAGGVGAGLLASALVTFLAANWDRMGRFARLGALEVALVVAATVAARWFGRLASRLALDVGFVAIGALLAVFGQTYQTGADPYQLFLGWAALGAPWVLVACAEELWLLETLVLGVGLARSLHQHGHGNDAASPLVLWALARRRSRCGSSRRGGRSRGCGRAGCPARGPRWPASRCAWRASSACSITTGRGWRWPPRRSSPRSSPSRAPTGATRSSSSCRRSWRACSSS